MGRKRTRDLGLPPRMYKRGPSYFFDRRPGWENLGQDYHAALAAYSRLIGRKSKKNTVGALLDEYLNEYVRANPVEDSTLRIYRIHAEHIRREWGNDRLEDVQRGDVQRFMDVHPKKWAAVNAARFFRMVLDRAVVWDYIDRNPLELLKFPKQEPRKRTLTPDEYERVRAELSPKLRVIMDLAYILSARVSEVAAIRWDDIRDGVLHMRRKKTKDIQPWTITPELQALLDEARKLQTSAGLPIISPYILTSERRKPFDEVYVSEALNAAAVRAGINKPRADPTNIRFHDLRRTAANADRKTAKDRLGHASERTTRGYLTGRDPVLPLKRSGGKGENSGG